MPDAISIIALSIQSVLAVIAVEQLRRRVLPTVDRSADSRLYVDVWIPAAIVVPFLFFMERRPEEGALGFGWLPLTGPIASGLLAIGTGMLVWRQQRSSEVHVQPISLVVFAGTGLAILLLGAAHDLTLWMGQCAFALAAALLWFNTPDDPIPDSSETSIEQKQASAGMLLAMAASVGQGVASLYVQAEFAPLSAGCMMLAASMTVMYAARLAEPGAVFRIASWVMSYGFLLAIGLLSVTRLIEESWRAMHGEEVQHVHRIAFGFGVYWIEGVVAIGLAAIFAAEHWMPQAVCRTAGAVVLLAAAVLAAWRISMI